jgi:glycosyltransferase involved in cell wall biosynthesis
MCADLGVDEKVEFLGWIGEPARSIELSRAMIFALPSYQEGLPMGILEAMAFGLAVIVTPVGGIGDVVVHNHNGLLVAPGSVNELARALEALLSASERCQEFGDEARRTVSEYTVGNISRQWISMYSDVMSEQNRAIPHER